MTADNLLIVCKKNVIKTFLSFFHSYHNTATSGFCLRYLAVHLPHWQQGCSISIVLLQTLTTTPTGPHLVTAHSVFYPTVSAPKMALWSPETSQPETSHKWSPSLSMTPSIITTSNYIKKYSMENAKTQTVAISRLHSLFRTNIPTTRPCKRLIKRDTKSPYTPLRKCDWFYVDCKFHTTSYIEYVHTFYYLVTTFVI